MKTRNRKTGYSANTAMEYIDNKQAIHCLSTELEPQLKFEDNQPTGEIIAYKAWFSQKGLPPFQVKFESEIDLPSYMNLALSKPVRLALMSISVRKISRRLNND
ncbi:suB0782 undefined product 764400:764714 forward MW:11955 [Streptococcus downei MFe28]|uniref:SuB0782 undefined product 764400:764714 forward MW:11955 n=1 Tax=Streptococcus downei MFe28 TaxID=764290 RepID=A0A380JEA4_STRDO|nr:suB0782 undefined product 764400:764714 forward MW:11955 [Streptococcus downei MFe28]